MRIHLSEFAGFCDGVKRAYEKAVSLDMEAAKQPVFILGSLVHNLEVARKIEEKGIKKTEREDFFRSAPGEIGTVIITAHGDGPEVFAAAKEKGIDIVDTTCPKVIKVQRLAKAYSKRGYKIVLVGDLNHKEVKGIDGWGGGQARVVSKKSDLKGMVFKKSDKIAIFSQTTQNRKVFEEIVVEMDEKFSKNEKIIIDTICQTTAERQEEIGRMAEKNDTVLVIGAKESANSKRLFEISREINANSYFIQNSGEIKKEWFSEAKNVFVSAGASTPPWIIKEVLKKLPDLGQKEGG